MKRLATLLIICLSACVYSVTPGVDSSTVSAQANLQSAIIDEPVIVGIYHAPPFAIESDEGWDGIGVHLWRDAAHELELDYEWRIVDPEQVTGDLISGTVDLVIGVVANAEDERTINFSHSYFVSSIGVAEPAQRTLMEIADIFFSSRFWQIAFWLAIAFLAVGILAWLFERKTNEEQFGQGIASGIWSGFWWAGVTMSTIGYGDKVPKTVGGRILALFWMLIAMGITALLSASLTSILTSNTLGTNRFPGDLRRMDVGSIDGSASAQFLQEERIQFQSFETVQAGLKAVTDGNLAIFVDDVAVLRFVNSEAMNGQLRIRETALNQQHHVFALSEDSALLEPLNRVMLSRIGDPAWQSLVERYVP